MKRWLWVTLVLGCGYVAGLGVLSASGEGILAAFLAMPAWILVGGATLLLPDGPVNAYFNTWSGNLALLVLSGLLNVLLVWGLVRVLVAPFSRHGTNSRPYRAD